MALSYRGASSVVMVVGPDKELTGVTGLPEMCANSGVGAVTRNSLFFTSSHSFYPLYLSAAGAHMC